MKWINVADQKPPLNERVLFFVNGFIRVGSYTFTEKLDNEDISKFVNEYAVKIVDQGDITLPLDLPRDRQSTANWSIDGLHGGWNYPSQPSFWMPLPYEPIEIKGLA